MILESEHHGIVLFVLLRDRKLGNGDLGGIVESYRELGITDAGAYYHSCTVLFVDALIIGGEDALIVGVKAADKRQTDLSAVGVTADNKVSAYLNIDVEYLRSVSEDYVVAFLGHDDLELVSHYTCGICVGETGRKAGIHSADEVDCFATHLEGNYLVIERDNSARYQAGTEERVLGVGCLVVAVDVVAGGDLRRFLSSVNHNGKVGGL